MRNVLAAVLFVWSAAFPGHHVRVSRPVLADAVIYRFDPPEPGLDEAGGWYHALINSEIAIGSDHGSVSAPNALSLTADYRPFHFGDAGAGKQESGFTVGQQYGFSTMVKADETTQAIVLVVRIYDFDPLGVYGTQLAEFTVAKNQLGPGWQLWSPGSFTPGNSTIVIDVIARNPAHVGVGTWVVDDLTLLQQGGGGMARLLSAFGLRCVIARAQSALNTEIGHVRSEVFPSTGVDLAQITGWRSYSAGVATPDVAEFEAYEIGDLTFPNEDYDKSLANPGQRTRNIGVVPIRTAINHANRGNADSAPTPNETLIAAQMAERSRLYGAAIFRCFQNDPTCGQGPSIYIVPRAVRCNIRNGVRISDDIRVAGRVEYDFMLQIQEQPTGETMPGGGTLPVVTLESP